MGKHYATIKDVAERAGTTAATVSYVLSDSKSRYISEDMRRKVLQAAEELDYIRCSSAGSLKGKRRKMIAVLVPQFANQFFTRIALAVEEVFDRHGYLLTICNTFEDAEREREILHRMQQQRVDGYIISPTLRGKENTSRLRRLGIPLVVVDRPLEGVEDFFWVTTGNYGCGYLAAEHLLRKGHRHIAFIGWDSAIPDLMERKRAFFRAAEDFGVRAEDAAALDGEFTAEAGYRMTAELLDAHPEVTGVVYGYNIQAKGGVQCLRERGVDVPRDLSVVIIGSPEWVSAGKNNFTHVDQGDYELGRKAAELLLEIMDGDGKVPFRRIIQDATLVEGESVYGIQEKE